ncbi:MAG: zinc ABC transporter substrate-binding protein, partial [Thermodesulfovibrionia bacterium]|nr:zinc ABC transporter substrate-binding protein [Thermodesulfovibrionia bacterium]
MIFLVIICLIAGLQACRQSVTEKSEKLRILTTIAPLYSFTKNIAGDLADVDNLLPSGAGPHECSFSPADIVKVSRSNVLIKNGVDLESWLDKLMISAQTGKKEIVIADTSSGVEIIDNDPHIWLSPVNAVIQVKNIRDCLVKADPGNSETYRENAGLYIKRLKALDREIRDEVRTWKQREFVALHPAFTYFTKDYGLKQAAVIQETPEIEPSPKHIIDVIKTIEAAGIKAIFSESRASHKIVD